MEQDDAYGEPLRWLSEIYACMMRKTVGQVAQVRTVCLSNGYVVTQSATEWQRFAFEISLTEYISLNRFGLEWWRRELGKFFWWMPLVCLTVWDRLKRFGLNLQRIARLALNARLAWLFQEAFVSSILEKSKESFIMKTFQQEILIFCL